MGEGENVSPFGVRELLTADTGGSINYQQPVEAVVVEAVPVIPAEPVRFRELIAILLIVLLADLAIYRGQGFAGYALLFAVCPLLFWFGSRQKLSMPGFAVVFSMLGLIAIKLIWSGSWLAVGCGFALLIAFAMSVSGNAPFVGEGIVFALQSIGAGVFAFHNRAKKAFGFRVPETRIPWLNVLLPAAALVAFSLIFTFANPDFLKMISTRVERFMLNILDLLVGFSPGEVVFWIATAWVSLGLMKPFAKKVHEHLSPKNPASATGDEHVPAKIYPAVRNTLVTVIALFAVYLSFEFLTLWFREFPDGFYYAGYAHEGAAWLTVALGLATIMLSLSFRGPILRDARLTNLRKLAWVWSAQNFILALAVYNRLMIYVNFNGMTRMRTIGFLGITCVVIGFVLVLIKISRRRSFGWLFQRQVLTVAIAFFVYAILPVDWIVQRYNTLQILGGDLAPSVQITEHPIDDHGMLAIIPLVDCDNKTIRDGVRAMLAERQIDLEREASIRSKKGWSAHQILDRSAKTKLDSVGSAWTDYRDDRRSRSQAIDAFRDYAWQWY